MITFEDDDVRYLAWRADHSTGLVVNHRRPARPGYLLLHRLPCIALGTEPANGGSWTHLNAKRCSTQRVELERWALTVGGALQPCRLCKP